MVIKKKLSLGLGFLFMIIFLLAGFYSYYIGKLSQDAGNILKDNYHSLVYSKNMISALEDIRTAIGSIIFNRAEYKKTSGYYWRLFEKGKMEFEKNLRAETNNITEIHENEYVDELNKTYGMFMKLCQHFKKEPAGDFMYFTEFQPAFERLKQTINNINDLNMQAVVRKSQITKRDAGRIISNMAIIAALCLILAFFYFWYFPLYVSNSLSYLTEKMKQLLTKMGIVLEIKTDEEIHVLLQAINLIENKYCGDQKEKTQIET